MPNYSCYTASLKDVKVVAVLGLYTKPGLTGLAGEAELRLYGLGKLQNVAQDYALQHMNFGQQGWVLKPTIDGYLDKIGLQDTIQQLQLVNYVLHLLPAPLTAQHVIVEIGHQASDYELSRFVYRLLDPNQKSDHQFIAYGRYTSIEVALFAAFEALARNEGPGDG